MSPVCEQDAFFPFCLYHCLFSAHALTDRCLRLANAMCVCLNLHGLQLKISSVCNASKWELHAARSVVWSRGDEEQPRRKRERGRGEWSRWETKGEKGFVCMGNSPRTAQAHLRSGKWLFTDAVVETKRHSKCSTGVGVDVLQGCQGLEKM